MVSADLMHPIVQWLEVLGLGQYGEAFVQAAIDQSVLPDLTDGDLEKLGVVLGHRKKLLRAISALASTPDPRDDHLPAPGAARKPEAERRQLTVMFCDLIGSTALSSRLDPEDLSGVIRGYQARVAAIISRFGGFIARYVGDGVLIYFGWPEAHEANAESAVRAALAVIDTITQAPVLTEPLQVRIGIANPGTCGYSVGALIRLATGHPDHAVELIEQGLALARDLDHPPTLVHALWMAAELRQLRREPKAVEQTVAEWLPLVSEHGSGVGVANATMLRGWAHTLRGDAEAGPAELRRGLTAWRASGSKMHGVHRLARAADACRAAGLVEEGLGLVVEAVSAEDSTDRWCTAEVHRLKGELLLLAGSQFQEIEACYRQALIIAQGARFWELRAAIGLARLLRDVGKLTDARDVLAPVYGWFTEGFDTSDLKEAKAVLEALNQ